MQAGDSIQFRWPVKFGGGVSSPGYTFKEKEGSKITLHVADTGRLLKIPESWIIKEHDEDEKQKDSEVARENSDARAKRKSRKT